jgi:hypothetical protein
MVASSLCQNEKIGPAAAALKLALFVANFLGSR